MHWLESEINKLGRLQQDYQEIRDPAGSTTVPRGQEREARTGFLERVSEFVEEVAARPGISGCLSSVEGLVVAQAGSLSDFDAVAAITQECLASAEKCEEAVPLGPLQQFLVIGSESKLAVMYLKPVAICIVSPVETPLSSTLMDAPEPGLQTP